MLVTGWEMSQWPPTPGTEVVMRSGDVSMRVTLTYGGKGSTAAIFFVHKSDDARLCVAVKFPHYQTDEGDILRCEEVAFTRQMVAHEGEVMFHIQELAGVTPHLLRVHAVASVYHSPVIVSEALLSYENSVNLLVIQPSSLWLSMVRQLLFQLFYTLSLLQDRFPNFRHNDLSTRNVMVSYAAEYEMSEYVVEHTLFTLNPVQVDTKVIDFACANADAAGMLNPFVQHGSFADFHIIPVPCVLYDVHYFFGDILHSLDIDLQKRDTYPEALRELLDFMFRVVPLEYFGDAYMDRCRLKTEGQFAMMGDVRLPRSLAEVLLSDPFFVPLRAAPVVPEVEMELESLPTELSCSS
jgi:hypothetical protein